MLACALHLVLNTTYLVLNTTLQQHTTEVVLNTTYLVLNTTLQQARDSEQTVGVRAQPWLAGDNEQHFTTKWC